MQDSTHEVQSNEILEKFDRESRVRKFKNNKIAIIVAIFAVFYSLFHVYTTFYPIPQLILRAAHLGFGIALIFLIYPTYKAQDRSKVAWYDYILFTLSIVSFIYLILEYEAIMTSRGGIANGIDIIFGVMTVVLVIEATRRVLGWILPILALAFLAYPFISHLEFMPNRLLTRAYDLGDIFGQMYLKMEGLYSTAISASVSFIFLFILFGAFLSKSGMGQLFNDLALTLAGHKKGGPAKVAVISSGFMGSINGSAVGNVVGTGVFTIPLMKRVGYSKNFAGAVEASASVGGQILPPIMGASAFIMAETTGVKYSTIALAAFLPAILYFIGVLAQVHFRASREDLRSIPKDELPKVKDVLLERGHLLLPIFALIYFLANSVPIGYAASYTIGIAIVVSSLKKSTRMSFQDIIDALVDGAKQSLPVMVACAVVGIIIGTVSLTGFASVMISLISSVGQNSLFVTLLLTMLASMVLGMGLPSIPAYIITATMAAPAIAALGVPVIIAHLFVFYFGLFANITPPVALASFAGAGISGGDPMKTGWQSLKLSLAGFIVPFIFVYNPALLFIDGSLLTSMNMTEFTYPPFLDVVLVATTSFVGVVALSSAVEGYFKGSMNALERIIIAIGALMLIVPEFTTDVIGVVIVSIMIFINSQKARKRS